MNHSDLPTQALETLILSAERLRRLSLASSETEPLLDYAMLIALRQRLTEDRPTFAGFIGCTGSGKSTLFNSLCGQSACLTGWKAHNTAGPVLLLSEEFGQRIRELEQTFAPLFFPRWKREISLLTQTTSEAGRAGAVHWIFTTNPAWKKIVLIDLPDINTTRARNDHLLAMTLLPWLDTVIFVVDEETLYHRDYEGPVALAKTYQQRRICVLNHRGRDRVVLEHPDLQGVRNFFGVDTIHVLPDLGDKILFDSEPAFLRFRDDLQVTGNHAPNRPILIRMAPLAAKVISENTHRQRILSELETHTERIARERLSKEKTIPIHRLLNDEALQVLDHLGLKRFSVSNLLSFFKRVTKTGSLKRSFAMAFGNHREEAIYQLIRLDSTKLNEEFNARLSDHREAIHHALLTHPEARFLGQGSASSTAMGAPIPEKALQEAIDSFEEECRSLIASDTLSASWKNDPLLTAGMLAALAADVLTLPGFGSWVLVPSVFQYIPLGKFEKTKRSFQQRIRDIIREALMDDIHHIQAIRRTWTLDSNDPLWKALKNLAGTEERE